MDIVDLKFFECVARVQNLNRAAGELNTVQSNVTAKIRNLEYELGVTLFNRHSRGVELTSSGSLLVPYALRIMNLVGDAKKAVSSKAYPAGPLVIGSLETVLAMHLGPSLAGYATAYPDVDVSIRTGTTRELVELVMNYAIEGALVCGPVDHPELCASEVFTEELCVVSRRTGMRLHDLLGQPDLKEVALRVGCSYRQRLDEMLSGTDAANRKILEFGSLEAVRATVAAGIGVAFLPRRLVEEVWSATDFTLHPVDPEFAHASTLFVRRRDSYVSPAQTALLDGLRTSSAAYASRKPAAADLHIAADGR